MHLHDLPWPTGILSGLGETEVTLRITLSYFIEPNPGERGASDKYAYQSHALRFAVRRPLETEAAFRARINAQATSEEADELPAPAGPADPDWFIGERLRRRGSLLSDSWTETASALAERGQLAVYPTMGWWRKRPALNRYERIARYALHVQLFGGATEAGALQPCKLKPQSLDQHIARGEQRLLLQHQLLEAVDIVRK